MVKLSIPAQVLEGLGLTRDQFIDMCILCGCDYCGHIKGVHAIFNLPCQPAGLQPGIIEQYLLQQRLGLDIMTASLSLQQCLNVGRMHALSVVKILLP